MTFDRQDLLIQLRKLAGSEAPEAHLLADEALLMFIDDEQISDAFRQVVKS